MVPEKLDGRQGYKVEEAATTPKRDLPRASPLGEVVERNRSISAVRHQKQSSDVPLTEQIVQTACAKTIVVVDDEVDLVDLTVMILEGAGHTAHGATHGPGGITLVVEHDADVLLVDYMMPNMTGGAVGKVLRSHPTMGEIKIVMVSGTSEETVRAEFDQFDAFLRKPVQPHQLLRTVEDLS